VRWFQANTEVLEAQTVQRTLEAKLQSTVMDAEAAQEQVKQAEASAEKLKQERTEQEAELRCTFGSTACCRAV